MGTRTTVFTHGHDPISHAGVLAQFARSTGARDGRLARWGRTRRCGGAQRRRRRRRGLHALRAMRPTGAGAWSSSPRRSTTTPCCGPSRMAPSASCGAPTPPPTVSAEPSAAPLTAAARSPRPPGGLLRQVHQVHEHVLVPRGLAFASLSDRESDVLRLVSEGLDTKQIATKLAYSERTIKNVIRDIVRRFGLSNRSHAVSFAIRQGLI